MGMTIDEAKEPTTKNDLGVDCISREATVKRLCNLAEYMNEHKENSGDPYIMAALFIQDNKTEFPSVTPQEPLKQMVEIDLDYVIKQKYIEREVLDKIKAEIDEISADYTNVTDKELLYRDRVLGVIDKYKTEIELQESEGEK